MLGLGYCKICSHEEEKRDNPKDFNQPNVRKDRKKEIFKGVKVEDDFKVINEKMSSASIMTDLEGLM